MELLSLLTATWATAHRPPSLQAEQMKADLDAKMAHAATKHEESLAHVKSSAAEEVVRALWCVSRIGVIRAASNVR